jgi:mono/diheme cytochrome c family protein
MRSLHWPVGFGVLLLLGCGGGGDRAPAASAGADSVALALAEMTPEMFDTIHWASDSAAVARGSVVWIYSCRRCHGDDGYGDGGFVQGGVVVEPPSLRAPDWPHGNDREAIRRLTFTGTEEGMPHWGLVGLRPRDVDAVAIYIQQVIRQ